MWGDLVVEDARRALDLSAANARTVLNALADDGYLSKRSGAREGGHIAYRVTEAGERELGGIDDPDEYLDCSPRPTRRRNRRGAGSPASPSGDCSKRRDGGRTTSTDRRLARGGWSPPSGT